MMSKSANVTKKENIVILDPGLENQEGKPSSNLGDLIIQESIYREIKTLFPNTNIVSFSTQSKLSSKSFQAINNSQFIFVGGTNLLSSNMLQYKQWQISIWDAIRLRKSILFGVGWWQYQESPNLYTSFLLRRALSSSDYHSVRDSYTQKQLTQSNIKNTINTACPTMWPLAQMRSENFPNQKSDNVLFMLTDYNQNPDLDKRLLNLLSSKYETVFFWPQGRNDLNYINDLGVSEVTDFRILDHSFHALQYFLVSGYPFDYIGTRLHGGVYCMRFAKRSLVIEIDNRAREIAKDTGLVTAKRDNFDFIESWIDRFFDFPIRLNIDAINLWKSQFLPKV